MPDPDIRWGGEEDIERKATKPGAAREHVQGCKFSNRCPFVMAECREKAPPLYKTAENRAVACYLYKVEGQVSGRAMAEALAA